jgi:arginase
MRVVPILFPSDLGRSERGKYVEGGERGAPDVILDVLESEGVRLGRPIPIPVAVPNGDDPEDSHIKFDVALTGPVKALAEAVAAVNAAADFPLILGGDHTALLGHVLGHSKRHSQGIGLAVLADAYTDLATPALPVYDDKERLTKDPEVTKSGNVHRMVVAGALRMIPEQYELGKLMAGSAVMAAQTSIAGVRTPPWPQIRANEKKSGIEVWRMDRLEFDGEGAYRSMLSRHLAKAPIVLSIDVGGLDPDMMTAVRNPKPDGLDWSFLKRSLEQCLPHVDRLLGLDICELDPTRDDAHQGGLIRFAETLAPFLKRLQR